MRTSEGEIVLPGVGAWQTLFGELTGERSPRCDEIHYDIENGRPTEGEHIIGDLVRRADRLGVAVPILRAALCNLQIYEARRRAQA